MTKSWPVENALPEPVTTAAQMSGFVFTSLKVSNRSPIISLLIAFSFSGRLSVRYATLSRTSNSTVFAKMFLHSETVPLQGMGRDNTAESGRHPDLR